MNRGDRQARVREEIRQFILGRFLPGEDEAYLQPETPLLSNGILDSIDTAELALHLEQQYDVRLRASEIQEPTFGSVEALARLIVEREA